MIIFRHVFQAPVGMIHAKFSGKLLKCRQNTRACNFQRTATSSQSNYACAEPEQQEQLTSNKGLSFMFTEQQLAICDLARRFAREEILPVAPELDRRGEFPIEILKKAWQYGLINSFIPVEYGGAGLGSIDGVLIGEEIGYACTGVASAITTTSLAQAPIIRGGSEQQKRKYLGMCTSEPVIGAYAVTESHAGSDVAALKTHAKRQPDGSFVLNGSKMWITGM